MHRARQELIAVQNLLAASNDVEIAAAFVVYQEALARRIIVLRFWGRWRDGAILSRLFSDRP